jgi:ABC-type multidrug transport system fused ATPase/permease subunit
MVAATLATLAQPWPLAIMLDVINGSKAPTSSLLFGATDEYTILLITAILGFIIVVTAHGLTVINSYLDSTLEQSMILDLRSDLFEHAQRLSLAFHDSRQTGELMARINYAAASLGAIVMSFPPILQNLLTLIGMAVIALLIDWRVTLISLSVLPLMYHVTKVYGQQIVPRLERVQGLEWESLSIVNEAMSMLRVIVPFGRERYEHRKFRDQGETAVAERVKLTVRQTAFSLAVTACTAAGTALVFYFGFKAKFENQITIGQLIVLLAYIAAVYSPLENILSTVSSVHQQLVALNSSFQLLDMEPEVKQHPDAIAVEHTRGAVAYEGIGFAYEGRPDVLNDISFVVAPGTRVAIVGPTGAGKTTLLSLLIRFYDPQEGRILLDGVDIRMLKLHDLRSQISVVLQEPLLFSGTIAANIRYGRLDASMDEIVEAAKGANAHDFITRLPAGYETAIGERGAQLSGGERQRIAVARAFLKDAPLLVLDEPTSSIDSKTEEVILDALDKLVVGRTSFLVAHRLSTVRDVDLILVMNDGRIVEQGTHDELLERDGLYRQLHVAQTAQRRRRRLIETAVDRAVGGATPGLHAADEAPKNMDEGIGAKSGASRQLIRAVQYLDRGDDGPLRALAARRADSDTNVRAVAELAEKLLQDSPPSGGRP